jgi:hypothetical protein
VLDAPDGVVAWRLGSGPIFAVNLGDRPIRVDLPGTVVLASDPAREGRGLDSALDGWSCAILDDSEI